MSEQDYIPGTTVICNLVERDESRPFGTDDQDLLDRAENMYVSERIRELHAAPAGGPFTFARMREVHRTLFQDVYAWAGQPRNVPMSKRGTAYVEPLAMAAILREQYRLLAQADGLRGIERREEFAARLAGFWGEINHAHAFREGNTRSQMVFFSQLAREAGWELDEARFAPWHPLSVYPEFVEARFDHQRRREEGSLSDHGASVRLAQVLAGVIAPGASPEAARARLPVPARFPELFEDGADRDGLGGIGPELG